MPRDTRHLLLLTSLGFVGLVKADDATKTAKIEEMLKAAKIDQTQQQMISMVSNQLKSGAFQQMFGGPTLTPESTEDRQRISG